MQNAVNTMVWKLKEAIADSFTVINRLFEQKQVLNTK